ncbi:hypothetical protein BC829DRAFT_380359 [Chytridium lagenaria]|nr:hypothetical protein BC829DRAFT_380359 [Chytridium lagenaria]
MGVFVTILEILLALIFPPLLVLIKEGCSCDLLLNVILTLVGWLPGVVHAIYVWHVTERRAVHYQIV